MSFKSSIPSQVIVLLNNCLIPSHCFPKIFTLVWYEVLTALLLGYSAPIASIWKSFGRMYYLHFQDWTSVDAIDSGATDSPNAMYLISRLAVYDHSKTLTRWFLSELIFYPEDGDAFHRNFSLYTHYIELYPRYIIFIKFKILHRNGLGKASGCS